MRLETLIEQSVPNWRETSTEDVLSVLTALTQEYVDTRNYTWGGIADVLGNDSTEALRVALETGGSKWAALALSGNPGLMICREDIQTKLYALEAYGLVPNASKLAKHVRRPASLIEVNQMPPDTASRVPAVLAEMKLKALRKDKILAAQRRYNEYVDATEKWNGDPATEPTL